MSDKFKSCEWITEMPGRFWEHNFETHRLNANIQSMRKSISLAILVAVSMNAVAQVNLTSKRGVPMLPEEGDWALGFNAFPFLVYLGNTMNGTLSQGSPGAAFPSDPFLALYGKKCIAANRFLRAHGRIGFGYSSTDYPVADKVTHEDTFALNETFDIDRVNATHYDIGLGLGREMRRGKGRIQGYYGPEVWLALSGNSRSHQFHNQTDPDMNLNSPMLSLYTAVPGGVNAGKRVVKISEGGIITLGVRAFAGVEYFFMPKVALGMEVGWGIDVAMVGGRTTKTEYYEPAWNDGAGGVRQETMQTTSGLFRIDMDIDNASGAINLFFYF